MGRLSTYHRFCCSYARSHNGVLLSSTGSASEKLQQHWAEFSATLTSAPAQHPFTFSGDIKPEEASDGQTSTATSKSLITFEPIQQEPLAVYERQEADNEDVVYGIVLKQPEEEDKKFDDVYASLLLQNARPFTATYQQDLAPEAATRLEDLTDAIVDLFDDRLRYISAGDKWAIQGRAYFFKRVHDFVRRGAKLEFCLPAFPCKSSNPEKVFGVMPDRGEQLALEHLHAFVEDVEKIYEPGAKLWIVSDGHVFSDCIGVDDDMVDRYNAFLINMNNTIAQRVGGADRVGFKSLVDLFSLQHSMTEIKEILQLAPLPSYLDTNRTPAAQLSREILIRGCKTDESVLRSRIDSGNHSALKLYRGFSRFMLEDLSLNKYAKHMSRSQLRKLSCKVSFEMIQRNEAYSNLVELLFPYHVRLSIHAHDNGGPKFGIRLFGPNVRALETLSFDGPEMCSFDLLHVPTPWHNSLVEVAGHSTLVMVKSKAVRDAVAANKFTGGWMEGGFQGVAGHYHLHIVDNKPKVEVNPEPVVMATVVKPTKVIATQTVVETTEGTDRSYMPVAVDPDMLYGRALVGGVGLF